MRIITISREFGSGGRELGKRMADLLHIAYYDREIITAIAQKNQMDEAYVSHRVEEGLFRSYPITVGRTFSFPAYMQSNAMKLLIEQQRIIKELASRGDCVMMGQGADVILQEHRPLNLFVYAEMPSRLRRCRERAAAPEAFTEAELKKRIRQVDAGRAERHELLAGSKWGAKESYHLCINTTGMEIKPLAPRIADYATYWFELEKA